MNANYLRGLEIDELVRMLEERYGRDDLKAAAEISQEKLRTLDDFWPFAGFLFERREIDPAAWEKVMKDGAPDNLARARESLASAPDPFDAAAVEAALRAVVDELGVKPKEVFQPVRVAISGTTVSPGIFESVAVLGRDETLARIDAALNLAAKTG
jgi:glutamyl-tRNA synthetase